MVINGPNMNLLGQREPEIYGDQSLRTLEWGMINKAESYGIGLTCHQSNSESTIIELIHKALKYKYDGIVINAAGYSHTSVAIRDALKAVGLPYADVHMSDPEKREAFRSVDLLKENASVYVAGKGSKSYSAAMKYLKSFIKNA